MTCYVDTPRDYPNAGLRSISFCHLLADDREELHVFAAGLGLPRQIFQDHPWRWHYDLPGSLRPAAIAAGAESVEMHDVGRLLAHRRAGYQRATG